MSEAKSRATYRPPRIRKETWENLLYAYIDDKLVVFLRSPHAHDVLTVVYTEYDTDDEYALGAVIERDTVEDIYNAELAYYNEAVIIGEMPAEIEVIEDDSTSKFAIEKELVAKSRKKT